MASLKRIWTMSLACGALLLCGRAVAQAPAQHAAQGPASGFTDIFADVADRYDADHKTIYQGAVEVVLNSGARLNCDMLTVYSYGPGEGPNAGKPPPPKNTADTDDTSSGSIKQMIAEGHVFYVTQNETVKGDHGIYDAEPDIITMTGNVVAVQGKNVAKGDKMVMDRKTNHTTMVSDATGRNSPNRVRGVFYNQDQGAQTPNGQTPNGQTQGGAVQNGQKPSGQGQAQPAPAKKP
jgi:lipopolysaccharide export system protein LptA